MSGDEMFAFVRRLLETTDELETLRRSFGCAEPEKHAVQAVQAARSPKAGTSHSLGWDKSSSKDKSRRSPKSDNRDRSRSSPSAPSKPKPAHPASNSSGAKLNGPPGKEWESHRHEGECCYTCVYQKRDCHHDHFECPFWKAKRAGKPAPAAGSGTTPTQSPRRSE